MIALAAQAPEPLRERKKRATREALRRAALELVAEQGAPLVTVEGIAARADVSTRTFFNYFPTKEDAIVGWDPEALAEMVDHLHGRPAEESALEALRATLVEVLSRFDTDRRDLLTRLQVIRSDPQLLAHHVSRWCDTERRLAAALATRRGTDPSHDHFASLVVAAAMAAGRTALMSWCDDGGRVSLGEELEHHLDLLASGLNEPLAGDRR
jgi:AcrR family transcriptional regulator